MIQLRTKLCDLLGIDYPIVQGAMAWVADAKLASAVSNAGGIGIVGTGHDPVDVVQKKVEEVKALTDKPFGVNVMLLNPHVEEVVSYLCQAGIRLVTTGAGSPGKYMTAFQEAGIRVIPVVASVALAKRMERLGADAVVVEGMEAGGHIGKGTTMSLLPQVVDAVSIPVIAAGGIADGRGVAAALMLGAEGVQIGTRFVCSTESPAHENFKNAILKASDLSTVVTGELGGHPVRVLRNQLTREYAALEKAETSKETPDFAKMDELGRGALRRAVVLGATQRGSMMSGQVAGLVKTVAPCKDIIEELVREAVEVYHARASYFNEGKS